MTASSPKPDTPESPSLKLFCLGPGVGESIVMQLPCGGWGVVDCYDKPNQLGTVAFLQKEKVKRLEFFCLTHPHADHYLGAHRLLDQFSGKIDRIWHHMAFTKKDIRKLVLSARVSEKFHGDPEAKDLADDYQLFVNALKKERSRLAADKYHQVSTYFPLCSVETF